MDQKELTTQQQILAAGEKEFLDKGFRAASLRSIVREAGVTTGAFYGYYRSKEALFRALVEEPARTLLSGFRRAQEEFADLPPSEQPGQMGEITGACLDWMVDYIYGHFTAFQLLLCCAEGTEFEHYIHTMVEIEMESTHRFQQVLRHAGRAVRPMDAQLEHILISGMLSGFFEIVVHDMPREKSKDFVHALREFYTAGWAKMLGL